MTGQTMNRIAAIVMTCLAAAAAAWADEVAVVSGASSLPYAGVKVMDVQDGVISFRTAGGSTVRRPAGEVVSINLADQPAFNQAEKLLAAGKADQAVQAYDGAFDSAMPVVKSLIQLRRLKALEQAGMSKRAVEEWVRLVEAGKASAAVVAMKPTNFAKALSKDNDGAIDVLEGQLPKAADKTYKAVIQQMLLELYRLQGKEQQAAAIAAQLAGKALASAPGTSPKGGPNPPGRANGAAPAGNEEVLQGQLTGAGALIEQGQAKGALDALKANLDKYTPAQLPLAYLLLGKAQMELAKGGGPEAPKPSGPPLGAIGQSGLLRQAGLDFMRVVAWYGESKEAPEALFLAGQVNARIGNVAAARSAYEMLVNRFADSDAAAQAKTALAGLKEKPQ